VYGRVLIVVPYDSLFTLHSFLCGPDLTRRQFLSSTQFLEFFERVDVANFEIASDAFSTFKVSSQQILVIAYVEGEWIGRAT
jgi:hypothetical protein